MANLQATKFSGGVFEKVGTTPAAFLGATMFSAAHQVFSTEYTFQNAIAVDPNNANKVVAAYRDATNNKGCVRIGTVQSDNTIVWGAESIFSATNVNRVSVAWDYNSTTSYIVVAFVDQDNSLIGSAIIGTVSGTSISGWGTKKVISNTNPNHQTDWTYVAFDPNTNGRFALAEDQHLSVCTHNGTVITQGSIVLCESGNTSGGPVIWDPNDATKFITVYKDNSGELHGRVCQVSGTTITLQAVQTIESSNDCTEIGLDADSNNANQFITSYKLSSNKGRVRIITLGGSASSWTLTQSAYYEFSTTAVEATNVSFTNVPNRFIVTYRDSNNNNYGTARAGTLSGTTVQSWDTAVVFNSGDTRMGIAKHTALDKTTNKFVTVYDTAGTDGVAKVGQAKVSKITIDLSTGSFFEVDLETATSDIVEIIVSNVNSPAPKTITFNLKVTQGSVSRQISWSDLTTFKWPSYWEPGVGQVFRPTISTTNDAVDIYSFTTYDNGTTWYATIVGQNIS